MNEAGEQAGKKVVGGAGGPPDELYDIDAKDAPQSFKPDGDAEPFLLFKGKSSKRSDSTSLMVQNILHPGESKDSLKAKNDDLFLLSTLKRTIQADSGDYRGKAHDPVLTSFIEKFEKNERRRAKAAKAIKSGSNKLKPEFDKLIERVNKMTRNADKFGQNSTADGPSEANKEAILCAVNRTCNNAFSKMLTVICTLSDYELAGDYIQDMIEPYIERDKRGVPMGTSVYKPEYKVLAALVLQTLNASSQKGDIMHRFIEAVTELFNKVFFKNGKAPDSYLQDVFPEQTKTLDEMNRILKNITAAAKGYTFEEKPVTDGSALAKHRALLARITDVVARAAATPQDMDTTESEPVDIADAASRPRDVKARRTDSNTAATDVAQVPLTTLGGGTKTQKRVPYTSPSLHDLKGVDLDAYQQSALRKTDGLLSNPKASMYSLTQVRKLVETTPALRRLVERSRAPPDSDVLEEKIKKYFGAHSQVDAEEIVRAITRLHDQFQAVLLGNVTLPAADHIYISVPIHRTLKDAIGFPVPNLAAFVVPFSDAHFTLHHINLGVVGYENQRYAGSAKNRYIQSTFLLLLDGRTEKAVRASSIFGDEVSKALAVITRDPVVGKWLPTIHAYQNRLLYASKVETATRRLALASADGEVSMSAATAYKNFSGIGPDGYPIVYQASKRLKRKLKRYGKWSKVNIEKVGAECDWKEQRMIARAKAAGNPMLFTPQKFDSATKTCRNKSIREIVKFGQDLQRRSILPGGLSAAETELLAAYNRRIQATQFGASLRDLLMGTVLPTSGIFRAYDLMPSNGKISVHPFAYPEERKFIKKLKAQLKMAKFNKLKVGAEAEQIAAFFKEQNSCGKTALRKDLKTIETEVLEKRVPGGLYSDVTEANVTSVFNSTTRDLFLIKRILTAYSDLNVDAAYALMTLEAIREDCYIADPDMFKETDDEAMDSDCSEDGDDDDGNEIQIEVPDENNTSNTHVLLRTVKKILNKQNNVTINREDITNALEYIKDKDDATSKKIGTILKLFTFKNHVYTFEQACDAYIEEEDQTKFEAAFVKVSEEYGIIQQTQQDTEAALDAIGEIDSDLYSKGIASVEYALNEMNRLIKLVHEADSNTEKVIQLFATSESDESDQESESSDDESESGDDESESGEATAQEGREAPSDDVAGEEKQAEPDDEEAKAELKQAVYEIGVIHKMKNLAKLMLRKNNEYEPQNRAPDIITNYLKTLSNTPDAEFTNAQELMDEDNEEFKEYLEKAKKRKFTIVNLYLQLNAAIEAYNKMINDVEEEEF